PARPVFRSLWPASLRSLGDDTPDRRDHSQVRLFGITSALLNWGHCPVRGGAPMSEHSQFTLLGKRRFGPFFATQALGAFNDNAFRQAMVVLIGFHLGLSIENVSFYAMIAPAVFILPFFL